MTDFAAARKKMVENQLRTSSITDRRLLAVMAQVPRERFVPAERQDLSYIDEVQPLPAAAGPRYLGAPAPFARLVQLAEINTADRVLDLGCGTGYSSAVLASLAGEVVAVESDAALAALARENLAALSMGNAVVLEGLVEAGAPNHAPFDVVVLEGAVGSVPPALLAQLADGGRLVAIETNGPAAAAHLYVKSGNEVASRPAFNASLPPLVAAKSPPAFVF